jgi:hypothetical protein
MENLQTDSSEKIQIIRKGDTVTYNGEIWIIKETHEDGVDLINPMNPNDIIEGVKRFDISKEPTTKVNKWKRTPGRLLEKISESTSQVLEPGSRFSKQGQTFAEAKEELHGIDPTRIKILADHGLNNGYENIITSNPEDMN